MDPVTFTTVAAAAAAAGTAVAAVGSYKSANAQADADRQRSAIEAQWADRRALEEKTAGQRAANDEMRKARFAQSRLTALAGGSGSGASDPTVMDLWGDIEGEGRLNAGRAATAASQKAAGIEYQSDLDQWTTETNARIRQSSAKTSLVAGLLSAGGQLAGDMAGRYGGPRGGYSGYYR